jgi:hypothetical protein
MDSSDDSSRPGRASSGPLRIFRDSDGKLYVTGFGLWFPIETEDEGLDLIAELENQGYRMCT